MRLCSEIHDVAYSDDDAGLGPAGAAVGDEDVVPARMKPSVMCKGRGISFQGAAKVVIGQRWQICCT